MNNAEKLRDFLIDKYGIQTARTVMTNVGERNWDMLYSSLKEKSDYDESQILLISISIGEEYK